MRQKVMGTLAIAAVALIGLLVGRPAFADELYTIDTRPFIDFLLPYLEPVVVGVAMAGLGFIARLLQKYVGVEVDEKHRAALAQIAASKLQQLAVEKVTASAPSYYTKHQILGVIAKYIEERGPQAVKHFGLTPEALEAYIAGNFGWDVVKLMEEGNGIAQNPSGARGAALYGRSGPVVPPPKGIQRG
ncbi:hypothetical protein [uncultured Cohaesibacter sp.]|uniref:hypothetical protein n=1 Tax=uncultured Cohaesibacter sp. TaxID=1002546 RepID=UPI0029C7821E|nr:hypothetical protein [uncultured Cohaesibacter sp.]